MTTPTAYQRVHPSNRTPGEHDADRRRITADAMHDAQRLLGSSDVDFRNLNFREMLLYKRRLSEAIHEQWKRQLAERAK